MTRTRLSRAVLAVPAALSLALGGALLAAAPASAAPGDPLVITSPQNGATTDSRIVEFTGTGSDGAGIALSNDGGTTVLGTPTTVAPGGAWTISVTFPDDAATAQTVVATQAIADTTPPTITTVPVTFNLPPAAPVAPEPIVLDSPAEGAQIDSRFVDFVGTATPGATLFVSIGDDVFGSDFADADGNFDFQGLFPFEVGDDVTVVVSAEDADGNALGDPITRSFSLLAPIAAPVITSPTTGSTITGGTVTFRGTGSAGDTAVVIISPDEATVAANPGLDITALLPYAVVAEDGTFVITTTLPVGTYTAVAILNETPITSADSEVLSLPSNEVTFTLVAAAAPAGTELANTGPTSTGLVGPAAALLLGGLLLTVAARRRGARTVIA